MIRKLYLLKIPIAVLCFFLSSISRASYDRIRISITSSSDWTILQLKGDEQNLNAKGISLQGTPNFSWGDKYFSVNQSLEDAINGKSVQVQFDVILESKPEISFIAFENIKGSIGVIQMDFYQFNSSMPMLIDTFKNTNTSSSLNPKIFTVNTDRLLEGEVNFASSGQAIPRLLLAFYYPWYSLDSWKSPMLRDNPLTLYSSENISTILHHVHLAKQAGIDGFISSWWGPDSDTDKNLQELLAISKEMDFKVSMYFETLTGDPPHGRPKDEILSWMRYFLRTYGKDERFLQFDGKPAIFIWAAGAVPLDTWREVFETLKSEDLEGIYMANSLDPAYLQVFDSLHDYGPAFNPDIEKTFQRVAGTIKTYGWLENKPSSKIWSASTQPGYDDRSIPGRDGMVIDRENGAVYSRIFEASINSEPDLILITSFNEWWEHTHIEPSTNFGNFYLELTAKYADVFKGFKPRPPVGLYTSPISNPDGMVHLRWDPPFAKNPDSYNIYRDTKPILKINNIQQLATNLEDLYYSDLPPVDGRYYYAVTAVFAGTEGPPSESISTISSREYSIADPTKEIPLDIAIYLDSTGWISKETAGQQASIIIQKVGEKVNNIQIIGADELPDWILSHTRNNQPDVILTFGDFPDSIYPSNNLQPDGSLAELFLDDGNVFLNTGDYMFFGGGRNGEDGLKNMMDIPINMWGDNTNVKVTQAGAVFTTSLRDFMTKRPFHKDHLNGTNWEVEVSFADDRANLADPVIARNKKNGGRIGVIYQTDDGLLPRGQVISEIILNWLPTVLYPPWDVNHDGNVDFDDLYLIINHFGEIVKFPVFPNPDVDRNGIVDICDLVIVALHFGVVK